MLLASKYEEIYFPEVRDFVYITDRAYTRAQILAMESLVLNTLGFELTVPTPVCFLKRFIKAAKVDKTTEQLAHYFCERTMQEYDMLNFLPSTIAASCVHLALKANTGKATWTPTLESYSQYTVGQLMPCAKEVTKHVLKTTKDTNLQAVKKKYTSSKFLRVALIPIAHKLQ
jgi:cyclin B